MFESTARVEYKNGIRFYEQDILFDNYIFSKDIEMEIVINYKNPGFGIALIDNGGNSLDQVKELYLFKIGYLDSNVLYKYKNTFTELDTKSVDILPSDEDITLVFKKYGKTIELIKKDSNENLIKYFLPDNINQYSIGYYSNFGNTIKNISIKSNIPKHWNINIKNSLGGYIKFLSNSFEIMNCKYPCEIQQDNIFLKKGIYYLDFDKEDIEYKENDIDVYVFDSKNIEIFSKFKNILENNKIVIEKDMNISLRFVGTTGKISNIKLSNISDDNYIETYDDINEIDGGKIKLDLQETKRVEIDFIILKTPNTINNDDYYFLKNNNIIYQYFNFNLLKNINYKLYLYPENNSLEIIDKDENIICSKTIILNRYIEMFYNMNVKIDKFLITDKNDKENNVINTEEDKFYVSSEIESPIIAINKNNEPLDLSSSYRYYEEDGEFVYVFTNKEREIFDSRKTIKLSKQISSNYNTTNIYGIYDREKCNYSQIYRVDKNINNIDYFTKDYVPIDIENISIDEKTGIISIDNFEKYDLILVDYMKENSYCINTIYDLNLHEISISSSSDDVNILYDFNIESENTKLDHIITNIQPKSSTYIIMKRGV